MSGQRQRNEYAVCTDRRTQKIIHIHSVTGCCLKCNIRQRRDWYYLSGYDKRRDRQPSWKLVSKREKQWMKRPLRFVPYKNDFPGFEIEW